MQISCMFSSCLNRMSSLVELVDASPARIPSIRTVAADPQCAEQDTTTLLNSWSRRPFILTSFFENANMDGAASADDNVEEDIPETMSPVSVKSTTSDHSFFGEVEDHSIEEVEEEESLSAACLVDVDRGEKCSSDSPSKGEHDTSSTLPAEEIVGAHAQYTDKQQESPSKKSSKRESDTLSIEELIKTTQSLCGGVRAMTMPTPPQVSAWQRGDRKPSEPLLKKSPIFFQRGSAVGAGGTKMEVGRIHYNGGEDTKLSYVQTRDAMADRAKDRQLKKEHDKLVAKLLEEKARKAEEEEEQRKQKAKKQILDKERQMRSMKVRQWQEERALAAQANLKNKELEVKKKEEQKEKFLQAKKARRRRLQAEKQAVSPESGKQAMHNHATGDSTNVHLGSEPGSENFALDSLISQYIGVSSSLRAQLHITELRLASRARVARREREAHEEETSSSSPLSQAEKAHEAVSRVRKLLTSVDEELPTLHHMLSDVEFLAQPNAPNWRNREATKPSTPPIVRQSRGVLQNLSHTSYFRGPSDSAEDTALSTKKKVGKKRDLQNVVSMSPGAESSAFLNFNDAVETSKGGFATSTPCSPSQYQKTREISQGVHPGKKHSLGKSKSARLLEHKQRAQAAYGYLNDNKTIGKKGFAVSRSLSVAEIREIKRQKQTRQAFPATKGALSTKKVARTNRNDDRREEDQHTQVPKKKKVMKKSKKSKKSQRVEQPSAFAEKGGEEVRDGTRSAQEKAKGGIDELSSLYANHPSITFIP